MVAKVGRGVVTIPSFEIDRGREMTLDPSVVWLFMEPSEDRYLSWNEELIRRMLQFLSGDVSGIESDNLYALTPSENSELFFEAMEEGWNLSGTNLTIRILMDCVEYERTRIANQSALGGGGDGDNPPPT